MRGMTCFILYWLFSAAVGQSLDWTGTFTWYTPSDDELLAAVKDASGNCYGCGYIGAYPGAFGDPKDFVTIKFAPGGNVLWYKTLEGPGGYLDAATSITLDSAGVPCVAGYHGNGNTFNGYNVAIARYAPDGTTLFSTIFTAIPLSGIVSPKIAVDSGNNIFVGCTSGYSTMLLLKYAGWNVAVVQKFLVWDANHVGRLQFG